MLLFHDTECSLLGQIDEDHKNALHWAAARGHHKILQMLITTAFKSNQGEVIGSNDIEGKSPLDYLKLDDMLKVRLVSEFLAYILLKEYYKLEDY